MEFAHEPIHFQFSSNDCRSQVFELGSGALNELWNSRKHMLGWSWFEGIEPFTEVRLVHDL